ncbi:ANTAR domain-containing protein [Streptoalloteichus tenebrarius]|uniref:ANTAR domain-containing protein n=1 Tax=Streptoalloteichus tenebrarius (strain ATCC 17920 / DSM 40477 / JCM 4838 / CBS 697.72 / NBRC 16177 / NCIMB 11028 / NRRL B-12390 / A12253. 1 / ISP 5477) TaxID=1933 RepID=A0ABT1HLR7_STRSD|nr:SpoIIE family protein phosphatase [Streptoalloteichus tenebrarius]MCP2256440.1 ANTAR domain-containing protein [Streptoalloteichus tenebrarius]BFF04791.1 SpoIIE family protein phosphatase [Streptoalloteichus tenebrarius]
MVDPAHPAEPARDDGRRPSAPPDDERSPHGWNRLAATVERLRDEVRRANAEAEGRALIELAKGVLVERLRCGPAQAAQQLSDLAARAGLIELELAAELVSQAAQDRLTEAVGEFLAHSGQGGDQVDGGQDGERDGPAEPSPALRLRTAESAVLAANDTQRVAQSLLDHALEPLGAVAVAVWSAGVDSSLSLAGFAGFTDEEARRWHYVPPGVATPARRALTDRGPLWIEDLSRSGLPSIGHLTLPTGGRVVVPAEAGGRILGALEICWPQATPPQPPAIQRQIEALAELCAHTLETGTPAVAAGSPGDDQSLAELVNLADGLFDPALVLRPHRDAGGGLVDFRVHHVNRHFVDLSGRPRGAVLGALLLEAYPSAATPGQLFDKVERVYATGEAFHAERMPLLTLVDEVPLTVVARVSVNRHGDNVLLVWRVEDEAARLANLLQHAQRLGRVGGFEENTVTGEITWNDQLFALYGLEPTADPVPLSRLSAHAHSDDAVPINRFLRTVLHHGRPAATTFRLRRSDGVTRHMRVIAEPVLDSDGDLMAVRGAYQDISAQHWTEVALSATRDQLAHTEQRVAEQNRLALQLQQAIMPPAQPPIDAFDLRVAVRYRPAEQEHLVGGDWYDAVVLPSKQILVSVGDITGHGLEGATRMVVLRNALRGLAVTGASPGQLLSWLNLVAHHLNDNILATAICALYDPQTRVLRWARAGHLPPVLVRGRQATNLRMLSGVMLGVCSQVEYEEGEIQLEHDDVLLLYTDGLVERRDLPLDDCLEWLRATAAASAVPLEELLDHLLTHSPSDTDDDTCVVGIQLT